MEGESVQFESAETERERHDREKAEDIRRRQIRLGHVSAETETVETVETKKQKAEPEPPAE
jgi:hypothetical protein